MRFIHSCLRSSPYSTPPVPPTFALAPCPWRVSRGAGRVQGAVAARTVRGGRHADRRGRGGGDRCPGRLSAISRSSGRPVVAPAVGDASTGIAPSQTSCSCSAHELVLSRLTATQTEQTYICKLGTGTVQEGVFFLCSDLPPKQRRSRVYPETTAFPHQLARRIPFCFRIRQNDGVR